MSENETHSRVKHRDTIYFENDYRKNVRAEKTTSGVTFYYAENEGESGEIKALFDSETLKKVVEGFDL